MAKVDDVLEDPAAGIRVVFRRTSRETHGRAVVFELFVAPSGRAPVTHLHPNQEERIDVLHGSVGFRLGRDLKMKWTPSLVLATTPRGSPALGFGRRCREKNP